MSQYRCPYTGCTFTGTDDEVDDHRATGVHNDQPQAGSNLRASQYPPKRVIETLSGRIMWP